MKRLGKGALAGCVGVLLLARLLCAETIPDALFQEASSLLRSAEKIEQESFSEAYRYYKTAYEKIESLLSKHPTSTVAAQLIQGKLRIGSYSYDELKEKVLPQAKRKADSEGDPLEAIVLLVDDKADEAYLDYAFRRIIRIYKRRGQMEKAVEVALTRTPPDRRPYFLMDLVFDYAGQEKKNEALALLEKAAAPPPQPPKDEWQIEHRGANLAMIASAYILLEAPERARSLLEQALPMAKSASLLAKIAKGYANIGETEKADGLFERAKGVKRRWEAEEIAIQLAEAGRYDEAHKMLQEVNDLSRRVSYLLLLYGSATRSGDSAVASRFLNEVLEGTNEEKRSQEIYQAAQKWLEWAGSAREAGKVNWAVRFLERADRSISAVFGTFPYRDGILLSVAEEYWKSGEPQRVNRLLDRIKVTDSMGISTFDQTLPALYARIGKVEQALQILEKYRMGDGKIGGRLQVAEVLWERGSRSDALALLMKTEAEFQETVLKTEPGFHHEMIRLASQYGAFGEADAAFRVLEEAEKQALTNGGPFGTISALVDIARSYLTLGQTEQVDRVLSKAVELTEQMNNRWEGPQLFERIAAVYAKGALFQRALDVAERIKDDDQRKGSVWLDVAIKQLDLKQTGQGRERMAGAMKLLEKEGGVLEESRIAGAWLAAGEIDGLFRLLDQVKERDQKIRKLAWAVESYLKAGASAKSDAFITKMKSLLKELGDKEGSAEDSVQLGMIWAKLGDDQEAERFFARAEIQADQNDLAHRRGYEPVRNIAQSLVSLGQPERAVSVAAEIRDPSGRIAVFDLAFSTFLDQKKRDVARSLLSRMEETAQGITDPSQRWQALLLIAGNRIELGEHEAGLNLLNALRTSKDRPRSRDDALFASAYFQAGEYEKGIELLERALSKGEDRQPGWGKVIELGEMTFSLTEAGKIDQRGHRFLHAMLRQAEAIPPYRPNR